jgi:hypothetical protein
MEVTVSEMAREVFIVLTSTLVNIQALEDLKAMFTKFFTKTNHSGDAYNSVSISALEAQGGTRAPSVELDNARYRGISRSPDQDIFLVSALEGEQPPEGPRTRSLEKVSKKGAMAMGSTGSKKGATVIASGMPPLRPTAAGKDSEVQPIRKEVASIGIDGETLKTEAAAKGSQGAALKKRAIMKNWREMV